VRACTADWTRLRNTIDQAGLKNNKSQNQKER
jgi:hypothetical protein